MTDNPDTLLPCPECNRAATEHQPSWLSGTKLNSSVVCRNYGYCYTHVAVYANTKAEAIRKWNERAWLAKKAF